MIKSISHYRDLTDWADGDWRQLNIHLFIAANFNRYCASLIKKIGIQYLPSDATDSMLSLFCDIAYRPLHAVHQKNLDARGNRRNQIMLGTLKMITSTRMVDAIIREYPSYVTLDQIAPAHEGVDPNGAWGGDFEPHHRAAQVASRDVAFFAAEHHEPDPDILDREAQVEQDRITVMLEMVRSFLTPVQYRHIRYAVCEGLSAREIAERTGHSVTNVRIMLLNVRKKMLALVPPELADSVQEFLYRK